MCTSNSETVTALRHIVAQRFGIETDNLTPVGAFNETNGTLRDTANGDTFGIVNGNVTVVISSRFTLTRTGNLAAVRHTDRAVISTGDAMQIAASLGADTDMVAAAMTSRHQRITFEGADGTETRLSL